MISYLTCDSNSACVVIHNLIQSMEVVNNATSLSSTFNPESPSGKSSKQTRLANVNISPGISNTLYPIRTTKCSKLSILKVLDFCQNLWKFVFVSRRRGRPRICTSGSLGHMSPFTMLYEVCNLERRKWVLKTMGHRALR